jgi:signal transduction histidine kinase
MWEKIVLILVVERFKFTFHGEIKVRTASVVGEQVELAVSDTGTGYPRTRCLTIRAVSSRQRSAWSQLREGSGIGLALVQEW